VAYVGFFEVASLRSTGLGMAGTCDFHCHFIMVPETYLFSKDTSGLEIGENFFDFCFYGLLMVENLFISPK
jgi:hypothetical protein